VKHIWFSAFLLLELFGLGGCATIPPPTRPAETLTYLPESSPALPAHAPVLVITEADRPENLPGTPSARYDVNGEETVFVDPQHATVYFHQESFTGRHGRFYHELYRVHFARVPGWHLTMGKNGGVFILITYDQRRRPVLITTVHTCGCYLAFIPTSDMPADAYPDDWPQTTQTVYGITLPARLTVPEPYDPALRLQITFRSRTHRVMQVSFTRLTAARSRFGSRTYTLQPLPALRRLRLPDGRTTSFFHEHGGRKGYVKGAFKPLEMLLMGWWALDFRIGQDKRFGSPAETGVILYTSLKPWHRSASNLWPLERFFAFWGWRL